MDHTVAIGPGNPFFGIEITQPALEDVFLRLTAEKKRGDKK